MLVSGKTIHVTKDSVGKTHQCSLPLKQVLCVVLSSDAGTPYKWAPARLPSLLKVVDQQDELVDKTANLCGGGASRMWYFLAFKKGTCQLKFELTPFSPVRPTGGTCTVNVEIT